MRNLLPILAFLVFGQGTKDAEDLLRIIFGAPKSESKPDSSSSAEQGGDTTTDAGVREPPGLATVDPAETNKGPTYIMGGSAVADTTAPWQAQIYYPKVAKQWKQRIAGGEQPWLLQHYCGGALIAPNWVVTAAHCIDEGMMQVGYRIRLGQERIDRGGGWTYKIDRVIRHPKYVPLGGGDIALIHFVDDTRQTAPSKSQVRPVALFRGKDLAPKERVTAFGWGRTSQKGEAANAILLRAPLNVFDRASCVKANVALIDARVFCATGAGRKTCSNDSGGPLLNGAGELVGIVSAGSKDCSNDGVPGVYTRVAAYLPWITKVTGGAVR